jgi:hypothetical protein
MDNAFNGEHALELEIEEFLASLCLDPLCKIQIFEDLQGMTKEDMQNSVDKQENQGSSDYIEVWFQTNIIPYIPSFSNISWHHINQSSLVPHIWYLSKHYLSNLNMSIFVILLRTWIHWKCSYT